jgi:hypothetical protein
MRWRVLKLSPKYLEKPATHLVDAAIAMGAKIVSVDVGKLRYPAEKGIDKNDDI